MKSKTRFIVQAAIIAALYAALTLLPSPLSYGMAQLRVSEALTVLPFFTPAAIPGLFIGCILGNLASPFGIVDIVCGSTASLIAAILSRKMPSKWLAPLPPVIMNSLVVGTELYFLANTTSHYALYAVMLMVGAGEALVCYGLGFPFLLFLQKTKLAVRLFKS